MEVVISKQLIWFMVLSAVWALPWKAYALWVAANRGEKWWFVVLLVVNTLAVLEIVYIFAVAKKGKELQRALGFK